MYDFIMFLGVISLFITISYTLLVLWRWVLIKANAFKDDFQELLDVLFLVFLPLILYGFLSVFYWSIIYKHTVFVH